MSISGECAMTFPKSRILCTEDDPDNRDLIVLTLSRSFEVICASNAEDAVKLAKTERYDLYLMDTWLHGVSGITLSSRIREFDSDTPILFYSGAAADSDKEAAKKAGAQGYLVKPANGDELVTEVNRLLASSDRGIDQNDTAN
jgi:DNA-binding response OmpR family regulator